MNKGFNVGVRYRWLSISHYISNCTLSSWSALESGSDYITVVGSKSFSSVPVYLQSISFSLLSEHLPASTSGHTYCGSKSQLLRLLSEAVRVLSVTILCSLNLTTLSSQLWAWLLRPWLSSSFNLRCPHPLHICVSQASSTFLLVPSNEAAQKD